MIGEPLAESRKSYDSERSQGTMRTQPTFLNAIKWSFAGIWSERAIVALFTVILAAILGPKDFGLVAIAWVFINFIQMFLDQGLVAALIQKKALQQEHLDSVFWMDLVLSFGLAFLSIALSHWWAVVNHAPQVAILISVLSLCIPIEGLSIVQKTVLSKTMDFKSLSIRSTVAVLASGVVGLGLAWAGFGVWALVGQQVTRDVVSLALLWKISPWRPRWEFSWPHFRELLGFSLSNFAAQLGIFADTQAGTILVGLFFGPVPVGLFRLADRIVTAVVAACTSSIQAVSLPEFSRLQDQPSEVHRSALMCIRLSSIITLPALAGLAAVSDSLMATLGPKWIPAADVLKVLCATGMVIVFAYFTGPMLQAMGKPHLLAILEWCRTALGTCFLIAVGTLVRNDSLGTQIVGVAVARFVAAAFVVAPVFVYILMRQAGISIRELIVVSSPAVAASAGVVSAVLLVRTLVFLNSGAPAVLLASEIVCGTIVGVPILLFLDPQLRQLTQQALRRFGVS
jgi:O-antigen/teichoic acid export membrane protein